MKTHQITSHAMTWHLATNQITSPHVTSQPTAVLHRSLQPTTSKQVTTSPPWNGWRLVHSKNSVWASQWLVTLCTFYRQILSLPYSFFLWNFRPRLARLYLYSIHICNVCVIISRSAQQKLEERLLRKGGQVIQCKEVCLSIFSQTPWWQYSFTFKLSSMLWLWKTSEVQLWLYSAWYLYRIHMLDFFCYFQLLLCRRGVLKPCFIHWSRVGQAMPTAFREWSPR